MRVSSARTICVVVEFARTPIQGILANSTNAKHDSYFPVIIDYRVSGQTVPAGITVYGQSDPSVDYSFNRWAHTWFFNRYGGVNSAKWPTAEAYIDLGTLPSMNEYTVHQTFSPTSYTWGYLAACKR